MTAEDLEERLDELAEFYHIAREEDSKYAMDIYMVKRGKIIANFQVEEAIKENFNKAPKPSAIPSNFCDNAVVSELRKVRETYDKMENSQIGTYGGGDTPWRLWKGVRNVITDRIEELTGGRE